MRIKLACECGAAVDISDLDETPFVVDAVELWEVHHQDHQAVSPFEARKIRDSERELRRRAARS